MPCRRASRTSSHSDQQRDRRRPEITIVAAEPLRPSSWFPGASPVTPQGLGFPSASSHAQWRRNEHLPAELPPSYEQVIKEINQVQVNTTNNNNAAASRQTTTSATQTDFPEELISHLPGSNVKTSVSTHWESGCQEQSPRKPPRPPASLLGNSPAEYENPLMVFENHESQRCQVNPNAVICPVPKPRSRSNLRPVVKSTESKTESGEEVNQCTAKQQQLPIQQSPLLDEDSLLDNHLVIDSMSTERSQNSIVSRIKVFESQGINDTSGSSKKPEIAPRSFVPRSVTTRKPVIAPKPGVGRISEEWDAWTESRSLSSKELQPQPEIVGSSVITKPELLKKPKPSLVKSSNSDFLDARSGSVAENSNGQKRFPVPAPRPLVPKKSCYSEDLALSLASLKPVAAPPRPSLSAQEKVLTSLGELSPADNSSAPALQNKLDMEGDLISFDDDVLPLSPVSVVKDGISSEATADPFQFLTKNEPAKEQMAQPALARKPTVIRILAKPGKSLNDIPYSPPPLPAEKPIGNTSSVTMGKPSSGNLVEKGELDHSEQCGMPQLEPLVPPRPVDGKIIPARPPPPKSVPGRPPPPKFPAAKTSSQKDVLSRSSSDIAADKKTNKFRLGSKRAKSAVFKNLDPALPPRPKPGHPLYTKYMLPEPHRVAEDDCLPINTGELFCKDSNHPPKVSDTSAPHAVVLHDFPAEHADDLDLHSGDTICLLEKIDTEWYRGKCGNRTGIFPANFVKVIIDVPEEANKKKIPSSSRCINIVHSSLCSWPCRFFQCPHKMEHGRAPYSCARPRYDRTEYRGTLSREVCLSLRGPRCVARFEYIGDQKDELSFSEGETIILKEYINEEWAKGELRGTSGIFPLNFVEVIEDLPGTGTETAVKNEMEFSSSLSQVVKYRQRPELCIDLQRLYYNVRVTAEPDATPTEHNSDTWPKLIEFRASDKLTLNNRRSVEWCEALHDFTAETKDDLSFKKGDYIQILEQVDLEWYRGRLNGKEGIFPAIFVQTCSARVELSQPGGGKKGKAKALYAFHGENEDELSFKAGDMITELESVDEDWMSGEILGKSGIFPKNFVQILKTP